MSFDRFSGDYSTTDAPALSAFEHAVWNVAAHRPDAGVALTKALAADPDFIAAHALKGFAGVMLARRETVVGAIADYRNARAALAQRGGTTWERALVESLEFAVSGRLLDAAARLEQHLQHSPCNFLAIKLSHALRFMRGDLKGMLRTTSEALSFWTPSTSGYGFVLGCHAFGLEEAGRYDLAERFGRRAIEHEPADAWALHAVGHVFEMQGRVIEGARWQEMSRPIWSKCNNFSFHMAWHLALFYLAQNRMEEALALYDVQVRPTQTDDFRDVANAVSFLWRLRQEGFEVGDRWDGLVELARKRATDTTLVFGSLHHLLTLVAVGDLTNARILVAKLDECAHALIGDQSSVAASVGLDLAQAILSLATGTANGTSIAEIPQKLPPLGGSNAQRDVFMRTLALIAADAGQRVELETVLAARNALRREDRFTEFVVRRIASVARNAA